MINLYIYIYIYIYKCIYVNVFRSKKSSSAILAYEQQAHKCDAFQSTIQLLVVTTIGVYIRIQAVCAKRPNVER